MACCLAFRRMFVAFSVFSGVFVCCVFGIHLVAGVLGLSSGQRYSRLVHAYPSHVPLFVVLSAWRVLVLE